MPQVILISVLMDVAMVHLGERQVIYLAGNIGLAARLQKRINATVGPG